MRDFLLLLLVDLIRPENIFLEALFNLMTWTKKTARTQFIKHHCIIFTLIIFENFTRAFQWEIKLLVCLCLQIDPNESQKCTIVMYYLAGDVLRHNQILQSKWKAWKWTRTHEQDSRECRWHHLYVASGHINFTNQKYWLPSKVLSSSKRAPVHKHSHKHIGVKIRKQRKFVHPVHVFGRSLNHQRNVCPVLRF